MEQEKNKKNQETITEVSSQGDPTTIDQQTEELVLSNRRSSKIPELQSMSHRIDSTVKSPRTKKTDPYHRFKPEVLELPLNDLDKTVSLYEKWRQNPHIKMQVETEREQSLRSSHNAHYNQQTVQKVTDSVFTKRMLGAKTYYTALKETVGMHPKRPVYHKERISDPLTARSSTNKGGSLYSPTVAGNSKINTPKSSQLRNMSTFHKDLASENKFYYLGRRRQEEKAPETSDLIKSIFEGTTGQDCVGCEKSYS